MWDVIILISIELNICDRVISQFYLAMKRKLRNVLPSSFRNERNNSSAQHSLRFQSELVPLSRSCWIQQFVCLLQLMPGRSVFSPWISLQKHQCLPDWKLSLPNMTFSITVWWQNQWTSVFKRRIYFLHWKKKKSFSRYKHKWNASGIKVTVIHGVCYQCAKVQKSIRTVKV